MWKCPFKVSKRLRFQGNNAGFHDLWHLKIDPETRKLVIKIANAHKTNKILSWQKFLTENWRKLWGTLTEKLKEVNLFPTTKSN